MLHPITNFNSFKSMHIALEEQVSLGFINKQVNGDLTLYDYSKSCIYERAWNDATMIARGLVVNIHEEKIVALPFPKFFNEGGEHDEHGPELGEYVGNNFVEKMDGSCVIIYHYKNEWHVNTRGSFESEQAIKAKEILHKQIDLACLVEGITYIAEVIYPENQIVVNYQDRESLVLTGVYGNSDFQEKLLEPSKFKLYCAMSGFECPEFLSFDSLQDARIEVDTYDHNKEGFVYRSGNGVRVKIKGAEYCRIHGLIAYHTPLFLWRCYVEHGKQGCLERKMEIPEENWEELDYWLDIYEKNFKHVCDETLELAKFYKHLSDKDLAEEIRKGIDSPRVPLLFASRKESFAKLGDKSYETICNTFKPKNNKLIKLYVD